MSGTSEDYHPATLVCIQIRGSAFSHALVPHELCLDKMFEDAGFRRPVHFKGFAEAPPIGLISGANFLRQVRTLLSGNPGNANLGNCRRQRLGHVKSTYRNPMLACEPQNWRVQPIIPAPALIIFGGSQELLFRGSSGNIVVHLRLEGLLKIFHSDRHAGVQLEEPPDDLELV